MAKINNIIVLDDAIVFKKCTQDFVCVLVLYILFISISSNEQMKKKKNNACSMHCAYGYVYVYVCDHRRTVYIIFKCVATLAFDSN